MQVLIADGGAGCSSAAGSGIFCVLRALRHSLTNGPTVTSNAPSESADSAWARESTAHNGSLSLTGSRVGAAWLKRLNSLSGS